MGIAIANELYRQGAEVLLVLGPVETTIPSNGIQVVRVTSAEQMYEACIQNFENIDLAIMAAAVADYTPVEVAKQKIKKKDRTLLIELTKTRDILKDLGERKVNSQVLVGFALETSNEKENAKEKLERKNADMIIMNSLNDPGAGFRHDTNKVTIFQKGGREFSFDIKSKDDVAHDIVETIIKTYYA
jgi:phosphopantothenoylcysteine decarboxylase/phosphopantothenate--cysteine ligase